MLLPLVVLSLCVSHSVSAQTLTTGALAGTIRSATGEPLTGVLVSIRDLASGLTRSVTTDFRGSFNIQQLAASEYEAVAELAG